MRLCVMLKMDRGLVAISKDSRLTPQKRPTRHSHSRAIQTITCGTEKRRTYFFPRTVRDWNAPPPDIPDLDTLEATRPQCLDLPTSLADIDIFKMLIVIL